MGYKAVCLECRRVESLGTDFTKMYLGKCAICSNQMVFIDHKFRPPKKNNTKKWLIIKYLISEGYYFQHINDTVLSDNYVNYPKTMREAKEFVFKYKYQQK